MKKILLTMLGVAGMLCSTSCSDEEIVSNVEGDAMVQFTVELSDGSAASRAISDGLTVRELYYEVYSVKDGKATLMTNLDAKVNMDVVNGVNTATVNLALVKGQAYDVVFWAQTPDAYDANDLRNIAVNQKENANNEAKDAFTAVYRTAKVTGPIKETIYLTRPFAQINFGTPATDIAAARAAGATIAQSEITVTGVATSYDALAEEGKGLKDSFTFELGNIKEGETLTVGTETYKYLATAYVLFPGKAEEQVTTDLTMRVPTGLNQDVVLSVPNAPAQRNYRTNVLGNLLTNTAEFNIVVDPIYNTPDNNIDAWNGNVEEPDYNAETKTYTIENAAQLAWLAEESYNKTIGNVTISIVNDIDLNGKIWTPIKVLGKPGVSNVTIKGNGKTISNFKVEGGKPAGLINELSGTVNGLTVEYAEIKGEGASGALVGKLFGSAVDCHAKHVSVEVKCEKASSGVFEDADKAGALIGQVAETHYSYEVTNCSVEDATVWGYRDLGSIIGYSNDADLKGFVGNVAKNVTITVDMMYHLPYEEGKVQNVAEFVGNRPELTGTAENVKIVYEAPALLNGKGFSTLAEALTVAKSGDVIKIAETELVIPAGIKVGGKQEGTITFEGVGEKSVLKFDTTPGGADGGLNSYADGVNLIFKNLKVVASNVYDYVGGFGRAASVLFDHCVYTGVYRAVSSDVRFEYCTIDPQTKYIYTDYANVDFIECTFNCSKGKGIQVYNDGNVTSTTINVERCTFVADEIGYTWDKKPVTAIDINSNGEKFVVNIKNSTATGFGVGEYSSSTLWNIKGGAEHVTVNLENCNEILKVTPENIATMDFNKNATFGLVGDFSNVNVVSILPTEGVNAVIDAKNATFGEQIIFKVQKQRADGVDFILRENARKGEYIFKNFTAKSFSVEANNTNLSIVSSNLESMDFFGGNVELNIANNIIDSKGVSHKRYDNGTNTYGVYVSLINYDLKFIGNTVTNTADHNVAINGLKSTFNPESVINTLTFTGNTLSEISKNKNARAGFKIWDDHTFAPVGVTSKDALPEAGQNLIEAINNNTFVKTGNGNSAYKYDFYGYKDGQL